MTVATTASSTSAEGNGATTSFAYSFVVPSAASVVVSILNATTLPNVVTVLAPSQYAITGIGNTVGGFVVYPLTGAPLATGYYITVQRIVPLQQLTSITNQGDFFPQAIETALDNLEYQIQQISNGSSRAIQINPADIALPVPLPPAAQRALQVLTFDAQGQPTVGQPSSVPVSSAMQPVVAAATTAAALAALGGAPALVGAMTFYAPVHAPPAGWLYCDGSLLDIVTYPQLYDVLGTEYGGDGITTFGIPDCRGRALFAIDNLGGTAANRVTAGVCGIDGVNPGASGGDQRAQQDTLTATSAVSDPTHAHNIVEAVVNTFGSGTALSGSGNVGISPTYATVAAATGITVATTVSSALTGASQNMPPAIMLPLIIYAGA